MCVPLLLALACSVLAAQEPAPRGVTVADVLRAFDRLEVAQRELRRCVVDQPDGPVAERRRWHEERIAAARLLLDFADRGEPYLAAVAQVGERWRENCFLLGSAMIFTERSGPASLRQKAQMAMLCSLRELTHYPAPAGDSARQQLAAWCRAAAAGDTPQREEDLWYGLVARCRAAPSSERSICSKDFTALYADLREWWRRPGKPAGAAARRVDLWSAAAQTAEACDLPGLAVALLSELNSEAVQGRIRRLTLAGKPLELRGKWLDGTAVDVASLRGKVVVVDFWFTRCTACVAEMKETLEPLWRRYHERGFEIVGVCSNDAATAQAFLKDHPFPWRQIPDAGEVGLESHYGIWRWPTTFLVDRQGMVVSTTLQGEALAAEVAKLIDAKAK